LCKVGFENTECLTLEERQALELIRLLPECLILEQHMQVRFNLENFRALSFDQKWLDDMVQEQHVR